MYVFSSKPASLFSMSMQYEHAVCICRFAQTLMCLFLLPHIWANYKDLSQSQARPPPALSSI